MDDSLLDEIIMGTSDSTTQQDYPEDYDLDNEMIDKMINEIEVNVSDSTVNYFDGSCNSIESDILAETIPLSSKINNSDNKNTNVILDNTDSVKVRIKRPIHEFCCLCGVHVERHNSKRHKFFPCMESYRCKKCFNFFYQHNHASNPCFEPFKHIV